MRGKWSNNSSNPARSRNAGATATGEFVFEVDEGWWVEDGKVKHLVRDANLLGIGPEVLKSIDRVGWES